MHSCFHLLMDTLSALPHCLSDSNSCSTLSRLMACVQRSAAWSWLIVQHIAAEEVVNTHTLRRKAFHSCLQRSLFGNQVVCLLLFFSFFWFKMVYAFKMSKEDLECDINAPQCQATGTAVAWHWGFYSFKNLFKNNWILNRPAEKKSESVFVFKRKRLSWYSVAKQRLKERLMSARGPCEPSADVQLKIQENRGQAERSVLIGKRSY